MSLPENEWFTEVFQNEGTAFSLQIKKHLQQEKSPYQTIDMYETETFGNLMSIDGWYGQGPRRKSHYIPSPLRAVEGRGSHRRSPRPGCAGPCHPVRASAPPPACGNATRSQTPARGQLRLR